MTESCYPSVPLSLQFNCSLPLYSLSFQNYQKREDNQGVHLSLKNNRSSNLYHHHRSCFVLIKVRITISIVPSICVDLFDSCESVGVEILSSGDYLASSAFLLFIYLFIFGQSIV